MKKIKYILFIILVIILILFFTIVISLVITKTKTNKIIDDYDIIYKNEKYKKSFLINNIDVFEQDISCGYAVIEMFAKWNNNLNITEKSLYDKYGKVVTSTSKSFEEEMNKQFPEYKTKMYKYLKILK